MTILKIGHNERFKESIFHLNNALRSKSQELQISTVYTIILLLVSSTLMCLSQSSVHSELLGLYLNIFGGQQQLSMQVDMEILFQSPQ